MRIDTVRLTYFAGKFSVTFERGQAWRTYIRPDTEETTVQMMRLGMLVKRMLPDILLMAHGWSGRRVSV